jgi:hypothetical protein
VLGIYIRHVVAGEAQVRYCRAEKVQMMAQELIHRDHQYIEVLS